jgi:hypothetical protein
MLSLGSYPPVVEAAALIGVVLVEAIGLYLVYGVAERLFSQRVIDRIEKT